MNTNPQLLIRHGVLLPPSLAPVAKNAPKTDLPRPETWRERQRRFRVLAAAVSGGMLVLVVAALLTARGRSASAPVPAAVLTPVRQRVSPPTMPAKAAISVSTPARAEPRADLVATATPSVSARPASQKIAASESRAPGAHLGVSKPQSLSVATGAFDAPFVPPAD